MKNRIVENSVNKGALKKRVSDKNHQINFKDKLKYFMIGAVSVIAITNIDTIALKTVEAIDKSLDYEQYRVENYYNSVGTSFEEVVENVNNKDEEKDYEGQILTEEEQFQLEMEESLKSRGK